MFLTRVKRPTTILASWVGQKLVLHNYRLRKRTAVDAATIEFLDFLPDWKALHEIHDHFAKFTAESLNAAIENLIQRGLLLREGSRDAEQDAAFEKNWGPWIPAPAWFHYSTQDVSYSELGTATEERIRGFLASSAEPPSFKALPEKTPHYRLKLPEGDIDPFYELLKSRRTRRRFSSEPISLEQLTKLLIYTWGVTGYQRTALLQPLPLKTSPSGGSRHPVEVYVMALNVEGLAPGFYYYSPLQDFLYRIAEKATPEQAIHLCGNQEWVGGAAALFFMTAVFARSMWKYPHPRMYRIVSAEFGHLCQTFCLTATSLGLASFSTMALADTSIEQVLGLDGITESIFYVAGAARPTGTL
jgi:SagB-type dehydrogenase family enzyme